MRRYRQKQQIEKAVQANFTFYEEPVGPKRESDDQWVARKFLQAAGTFWQNIPSQALRTHAAQYAIWLKERALENVQRSAPLYLPGSTQAKEIQDHLDALAKQYFPVK